MSGPHRSPVRRFVIGAALFLLFVVGTYFGVRAFRLAGVPDIGEPFDLQEYGTVIVDDHDNAFRDYSEATKLLVEMPPELNDNYTAVLEQGWEAADDELKQWLDDNQPALEIWRSGTEKPDALYHQPRDMTLSTLLPVAQALRVFVRLPLLNAQKLQHAGNSQQAWEHYRAALRCSRHSGMHGCLMERLVGAAIFTQTVEQMFVWSADEKLTAEDLRLVLHELDEIYALTSPLSETLRSEYFANISAYNLAISGSPKQGQALPFEVNVPSAVLLKMIGEGELSHRISRLFFANCLSQCDLPRYQRTNFTANEEIPFERDAQNPSPQIPLSRSELQAAIDKSIMAKLIMMPLSLGDSLVMTLGDDLVTDEQTRYAALRIALALQIHHREHGEFPASLDELEGGDLKTLPIDPYGQGQPLGYRRNEQSQDVTLWSVAADGVDDLGKVDWGFNVEKPGDWIFQVLKPGTEVPKTLPDD